MKYLVIGEPCLDVIHKTNGETNRGFGGILYSLITLSVLCRDEDEIYPIMNLGSDQFNNTLNFIKQFRNINVSGINQTGNNLRKVYLDYGILVGGMDRSETSSMPAPAVEFEQIEPFMSDADAVLINMISGVDISQETLRRIRGSFKGTIYIDIHNVVMRTNKNFSREYINPENWIEWCTNSDIVQMNETELSYLSMDKLNEYKVAEEILVNSHKKAGVMLLTRGSGGVSSYTTRQKEYAGQKFTDLDKKDVMAIENPDFKDSTGCGDVFAAAYIFDYMRTGDHAKALHFANRMASYKTSLEGVDQLYKLVN